MLAVVVAVAVAAAAADTEDQENRDKRRARLNQEPYIPTRRASSVPSRRSALHGRGCVCGVMTSARADAPGKECGRRKTCGERAGTVVGALGASS